MFSVLMSLYYKENPEYLKESLNSVFGQALPPDEVVLVEDGPLTDDLYAVVTEFSDKYPVLKVIPLPVNSGLGKALNEGLKHCSYDLVVRMDTDDISKPERFEKQVRFMESHPDIDVCSAWIEEFNHDVSNIVSVRRLPEKNHEIYQYGKKRNPVNHPAVIFRKHSVENVGGYQPFYLFEDYYLWVRMLMNGSCFYNFQESLLYFRTGDAMFERRGGLKYAMSECRFQKMLYKLGYINVASMLLNIGIRFTTRIVPNKLRGWIYKKVLR